MLQNTSLIEKKMFYGLREFLTTFQSNTCLLEKTTGRLSWILLLNHMFFPMWDLRACAFLSRYRLLDGILNPYIRSVQKGCYRNFKCAFMGVLRLSLDLVSSKFSIQSYKLTNLSQKHAHKWVIIVGCNPFQVPMTTSHLCYENMFQVWYSWVWCLILMHAIWLLWVSRIG